MNCHLLFFHVRDVKWVGTILTPINMSVFSKVVNPFIRSFVTLRNHEYKSIHGFLLNLSMNMNFSMAFFWNVVAYHYSHVSWFIS